VDGGLSYGSLMELALSIKLGANANYNNIVNLLYINVVGNAPSLGDLNYYVKLLQQGIYTQSSLGMLAADSAINAGNIDLIGLAATGLEFV
jgi:hypothetical protein